MEKGNGVALSQSRIEGGAYSIVIGTEKYARNYAADHLLMFVNSPNPFTANTNFRFALPASLGKLGKIRYSLKIYDISGKMVKAVQDKFDPGSFTLNYTWKGTDTGNRPLPAGYYLASFEVSIPGYQTFSGLRKVVKLR